MRLLLLALLGCASTPDAPQRPAPPADLTLSATPAVPGTPFTVTAGGAQPGESVFLGLGQAVGAGPCIANLGGACLDLTGNVQLLGSATANSTGEATLTLQLPDLPDGTAFALQAAVRRGPGGGSSVLSRPLPGVVTDLWTFPGPDEVLLGGRRWTLWWLPATDVSGVLEVSVGSSLPVGAVTGGVLEETSLVLPSASQPVPSRLGIPGGPGAHFTVGAMVAIDDATGTYFAYDLYGATPTPLGSAPTGGDLHAVPGGPMVLQQWRSSGPPRLHRLDPATGASLGDVVVPFLTGLQVSTDGTVRGITGADNHLTAVDPVSGVRVEHPPFGMVRWTGQTLLDEARGLFYVSGEDAAGDAWLWGLDLTTGVPSLQSPLPRPDGMGSSPVVRSDGWFVAADWQTNDVVVTDPATGDVRAIATIPDMGFPSGQIFYTPADTLYVWGTSDTGVSRQWLLDGFTGETLDTVDLPQLPPATFAVLH
jgi:hypothetical protein